MEKINDSQLFLTINNVKLEIVEETKYLGLLIDSNLSWDSHIQSINTKINKQIGILYRIKNILPKRVRLTYYYANINSHLIYALPIWGANYDTKLKLLVLAQKRAVRLIDGASYLAHTNDHPPSTSYTSHYKQILDFEKKSCLNFMASRGST